MAEHTLRSRIICILRILSMVFGSSTILFCINYLRNILKLRKLKRKFDNTKLKDSYEYIVCGAGSAGCVVARRLAEAGHTTLLIEAGQNDEGNSTVETPAMCLETQLSDIDWKFKTVPQKHSSEACTGRRQSWPRGKVLGGSSNLNYMVYMRGQPGDFNLWNRDYGCKGWKWEDVLPFYMKSENNSRPRPGHSSGGLLGVSDTRNVTNRVTRIFVETCRRLGMDQGEEENGADPLGGFRHQLTVFDGKRQSSSRCFIHGDWSGKENLDILTSAHVLKVNFKLSNGRNGSKGTPHAIGVCIQNSNGERVDVRSSCETILCGGSIGTPQILMCSGIGREADLVEIGVPVILNSPEVGQNLQDHIFTVVINKVKLNEVSVFSKDTVGWKEIFQYQLYGEGVLSSSGLEATAYAKPELLDKMVDPNHKRNVKMSSVIHDDPTIPAIQFHFVPASFDVTSLYEKPNVDEAYRNTSEFPNNTCCILVVLAHPRSTGTIKLKSSDPLDEPLIDPNYLSDDRDIETMIKGVLLANKISNTKPFSDVCESEVSLYMKDGLMSGGVIDTDAWRKTIKQYGRTVYHPVGTCRMGDNPKTSVCDPTLKVHGVSGLRIADLSICPGLTSGNTNAPAMMIGERCADFILSSIT